MANTSKSRSSGSSRGSRKSASKSSARSSGSRRSTAAKTAPVRTESNVEGAFKKFASSKAATPIFFIAAVLVITGIDLLVSWNKFELFFKILGIEILIAVVVWIVMTLVFSRRSSKDSNSEPLEDEV